MARAVRLNLRALFWCFLLIVAMGFIVARLRVGNLEWKTFKVNGDLLSPTPYASLQPCEQLSYCPDIRALVNISHERQTQLVLTRMLRVLSLICQKHGIRYFLYRGTLLGAARHHGHNPFDNDIDIAIPMNDYSKLITAVNSDLPDDIFFQTEETDRYYKPPRLSCLVAKLRDRKSCYTEIACKDKCIQNGLMLDISVLPADGNGNFLDYYSSSGYVWRYLRGPLKFKHSDIFPVTELKFDGFLFPVPKKWKMLLESWYGASYMTMPKPGRWHKLLSGSKTDNMNSCEDLVAANRSP